MISLLANKSMNLRTKVLPDMIFIVFKHIPGIAKSNDRHPDI
jgi:hypothetical protein